MDLWIHEVLRQRRAEGELALILSFKKIRPRASESASPRQ